jgi:hypothetical protein
VSRVDLADPEIPLSLLVREEAKDAPRPQALAAWASEGGAI